MYLYILDYRLLKLQILRYERDLVSLDQQIKQSVGLTNADPESCASLLEQYKGKFNTVTFCYSLMIQNLHRIHIDLEITPLMLKKNPSCVETMKRLRKYVGNAKEWNLSEADLETFNVQAKIVRKRAEDIYNQFKVNILTQFL